MAGARAIVAKEAENELKRQKKKKLRKDSRGTVLGTY
jgi:hypothetical protein